MRREIDPGGFVRQLQHASHRAQRRRGVVGRTKSQRAQSGHGRLFRGRVALDRLLAAGALALQLLRRVGRRAQAVIIKRQQREVVRRRAGAIVVDAAEQQERTRRDVAADDLAQRRRWRDKLLQPLRGQRGRQQRALFAGHARGAGHQRLQFVRRHAGQAVGQGQSADLRAVHKQRWLRCQHMFQRRAIVRLPAQRHAVVFLHVPGQARLARIGRQQRRQYPIFQVVARGGAKQTLFLRQTLQQFGADGATDFSHRTGKLRAASQQEKQMRRVAVVLRHVGGRIMANVIQIGQHRGRYDHTSCAQPGPAQQQLHTTGSIGHQYIHQPVHGLRRGAGTPDGRLGRNGLRHAAQPGIELRRHAVSGHGGGRRRRQFQIAQQNRHHMLAIVIHGAAAIAIDTHAARGGLDVYRLPVALRAAAADLALDGVTLDRDRAHHAALRIAAPTVQGAGVKTGGDIVCIEFQDGLGRLLHHIFYRHIQKRFARSSMKSGRRYAMNTKASTTAPARRHSQMRRMLITPPPGAARRVRRSAG